MSEDRSVEPKRWLERHGDALWAYAMLRLRDPDAAAEAIQETFAAALKSLSTFSGRSSERTWLIGILKHKIIDGFRRQARRSGQSAELGQDGSFDYRGHWSLQPAAWAEDASRAAERSEFWEVFRLCMAELPAPLAEAFTLCEVEGNSIAEICEILGISATNLHTRLYRARLLLRRGLESRWFGREGLS